MAFCTDKIFPVGFYSLDQSDAEEAVFRAALENAGNFAWQRLELPAGAQGLMPSASDVLQELHSYFSEQRTFDNPYTRRVENRSENFFNWSSVPNHTKCRVPQTAEHTVSESALIILLESSAKT
jgi:hypothetical protein